MATTCFRDLNLNIGGQIQNCWGRFPETIYSPKPDICTLFAWFQGQYSRVNQAAAFSLPHMNQHHPKTKREGTQAVSMLLNCSVLVKNCSTYPPSVLLLKGMQSAVLRKNQQCAQDCNIFMINANNHTQSF